MRPPLLLSFLNVRPSPEELDEALPTSTLPDESMRIASEPLVLMRVDVPPESRVITTPLGVCT